MEMPFPAIPVEVYLRSSYEPDAEYVDGIIEYRPAPEYDHASWQSAVMEWFWIHAVEWNTRVLPSLRIQVAPIRYRVPDVTVLDRNLPIEQIITHPPVAVFEILSPEDSMMRITRKLSDYSEMGIPHILGHRSEKQKDVALPRQPVECVLHLRRTRRQDSLRPH